MINIYSGYRNRYIIQKLIDNTNNIDFLNKEIEEIKKMIEEQDGHFDMITANFIDVSNCHINDLHCDDAIIKHLKGLESLDLSKLELLNVKNLDAKKMTSLLIHANDISANEMRLHNGYIDNLRTSNIASENIFGMNIQSLNLHSKSLDISNNAVINGDLHVKHNTNLNNIVVNGSTNLLDDVHIHNNLYVKQNTHLNTLEVIDTTSNNLYINNKANINNLDVKNNTNLNNLDVSNKAIINNLIAHDASLNNVILDDISGNNLKIHNGMINNLRTDNLFSQNGFILNLNSLYHNTAKVDISENLHVNGITDLNKTNTNNLIVKDRANINNLEVIDTTSNNLHINNKANINNLDVKNNTNLNNLDVSNKAIINNLIAHDASLNDVRIDDLHINNKAIITNLIVQDASLNEVRIDNLDVDNINNRNLNTININTECVYSDYINVEYKVMTNDLVVNQHTKLHDVSANNVDIDNLGVDKLVGNKINTNNIIVKDTASIDILEVKTNTLINKLNVVNDSILNNIKTNNIRANDLNIHDLSANDLNIHDLSANDLSANNLYIHNINTDNINTGNLCVYQSAYIDDDLKVTNVIVDKKIIANDIETNNGNIKNLINNNLQVNDQLVTNNIIIPNNTPLLANGLNINNNDNINSIQETLCRIAEPNVAIRVNIVRKYAKLDKKSTNMTEAAITQINYNTTRKAVNDKEASNGYDLYRILKQAIYNTGRAIHNVCITLGYTTQEKYDNGYLDNGLLKEFDDVISDILNQICISAVLEKYNDIQQKLIELSLAYKTYLPKVYVYMGYHTNNGINIWNDIVTSSNTTSEQVNLLTTFIQNGYYIDHIKAIRDTIISLDSSKLERTNIIIDPSNNLTQVEIIAMSRRNNYAYNTMSAFYAASKDIFDILNMGSNGLEVFGGNYDQSYLDLSVITLTQLNELRRPNGYLEQAIKKNKITVDETIKLLEESYNGNIESYNKAYELFNDPLNGYSANIKSYIPNHHLILDLSGNKVKFANVWNKLASRHSLSVVVDYLIDHLKEIYFNRYVGVNVNNRLNNVLNIDLSNNLNINQDTNINTLTVYNNTNTNNVVNDLIFANNGRYDNGFYMCFNNEYNQIIYMLNKLSRSTERINLVVDYSKLVNTQSNVINKCIELVENKPLIDEMKSVTNGFDLYKYLNKKLNRLAYGLVEIAYNLKWITQENYIKAIITGGIIEQIFVTINDKYNRIIIESINGNFDLVANTLALELFNTVRQQLGAVLLLTECSIIGKLFFGDIITISTIVDEVLLVNKFLRNVYKLNHLRGIQNCIHIVDDTSSNRVNVINNYKTILGYSDISANNLIKLNSIAYNKLEASYGSSKTVFDMILSGAYGIEIFADTFNQMLLALNIITTTQYQSIKQQPQNNKLTTDMYKLFNQIRDLQIAGINGSNPNFTTDITNLFNTQYSAFVTTYVTWLGGYLNLTQQQLNFWISMALVASIGLVTNELNIYFTNYYNIDNIKSTFVMVLDNVVVGAFIPNLPPV